MIDKTRETQKEYNLMVILDLVLLKTKLSVYFEVFTYVIRDLRVVILP